MNPQPNNTPAQHPGGGLENPPTANIPASPTPVSLQPDAGSDNEPSPPARRRPRGKIARLPKAVRDGFKNVRKRLHFKNRDYLFVTKDWPSALEYMNHVYDFADMLGYTRAVLSHGEDVVNVKSLDPEGPGSLTEDVKIGYIKFQNGSRIIAFSSNPYAMAVYGGDVGLDEFAKHPNAKLLWQTAQARVTWNGDLAVWSSHDGEDTLFNQFAREARAACPLSRPMGQGRAEHSVPLSHRMGEGQGEGSVSLSHAMGQVQGEGSIENQKSKIENPHSPWNLYFCVTMPNAVELGLLNVINRTRNSRFTAQQFLADCRARSGSQEVYQQSYMCNPLGAATAAIVEWSAIERCRFDYPIERVHLEAEDILKKFGEFSPSRERDRENQIAAFLRSSFPLLLATQSSSSSSSFSKSLKPRLGFDVAASGQGNLRRPLHRPRRSRRPLAPRSPHRPHRRLALPQNRPLLLSHARQKYPGRRRRVRPRSPDLLGSRCQVLQPLPQSELRRQKT
jgi:hypothetical protein